MVLFPTTSTSTAITTLQYELAYATAHYASGTTIHAHTCAVVPFGQTNSFASATAIYRSVMTAFHGSRYQAIRKPVGCIAVKYCGQGVSPIKGCLIFVCESSHQRSSFVKSVKNAGITIHHNTAKGWPQQLTFADLAFIPMLISSPATVSSIGVQYASSLSTKHLSNITPLRQNIAKKRAPMINMYSDRIWLT